MRASEALAILLTHFSKVVILFFQNDFGGISCTLISKIVFCVCAEILIELLLREYVVLILYYILHVIQKTLIKPVKLRTHVFRYHQFLLQKFLLILCCVVHRASVFVDVLILAGVGFVTLLTLLVVLCILFLLF